MKHFEGSTQVLIQMLLELREEIASTNEENQRLRAQLAAASNPGAEDGPKFITADPGEENTSPAPDTSDRTDR